MLFLWRRGSDQVPLKFLEKAYFLIYCTTLMWVNWDTSFFMLTCYTWAMGLIIVIQHLFGMIPAGSKNWPLDVRRRTEFCCRTVLVCAAVLCSASYDNSVKPIPVLGNNSPNTERASVGNCMSKFKGRSNGLSLRTVLFSELVLNKQEDFKGELK